MNDRDGHHASVTGLLVVASDADVWSVVSAIGTVVGGAAAAVAAIAAWRAAGASLAASRDARDALAIAIAPRLWVASDYQHVGVAVSASAGWPGVDVELNMALDGQHVLSYVFQRVANDQAGLVDLRSLVEHQAAPEPQALTFTLRYSDERRIARYEQVTTDIVRIHGGRMEMVQQGGSPSRRRIE